MNKQILSIAFKGQLYDNAATGTNYVYPKEDTQWAKLIGSDPRMVPSRLGINPNHCCYTLKVTPGGIIYAYRRSVAGRANSNWGMIMLLANGPTCNGKLLAEKMEELLRHAEEKPSEDQIDTNFLEEKLSSCKELFDGRKMVSMPNPNTDNNGVEATKKEAYRLYRTEDELSKILENPYQSSYNQYDCIHIVPAESNAKPSMGANIELIDRPIEKVYFFNFPQGVTEKDGKPYVRKDESFTLVYKRANYNDFTTHNLRIPNPSQYFKVENDFIQVQPAEASSVSFKRPIKIKVLDINGTPINEWQYKTGNNWNPGVEEMNLEDDKAYSFPIRANGYEEKTETRNVKGRSELVFRLQPEGLQKQVYLKPLKSTKRKNVEKKDTAITLTFPANSTLYKAYKTELDPKIKDIPTFYITRRRPAAQAIIIIFLILLGIGAGFAGGYFIWGNKDYKPKPPEGDDVSQQTNTEVTYVKPKEPTQQEMETHDEKYLSNTNIWYVDSLQSSKYKNFITNTLPNNTKWDKEQDLDPLKIENKQLGSYIALWNKYTTDKDKSAGEKFRKMRGEIQKQIKNRKVDWNTVEKNANEAQNPSKSDNKDKGKTEPTPEKKGHPMPGEINF